MNSKSKIKPGMYERICVVPDDCLIIVDDYGVYLPKEDFAQFEPDLHIIDYWGMETAEVQYHTPARPNETIDDIDFLVDLVEKHRVTKDIIENRKIDPLYMMQGEERKAKKKEIDKDKAVKDYVVKLQTPVEVVVPEGTFLFTPDFDKVMRMFMFREAAQLSAEQTVDLYDSNDVKHTFSLASAARIVAVLTKAVQAAVYEKIEKDKAIDARI